jgi:hypothetical protein
VGKGRGKKKEAGLSMWAKYNFTGTVKIPNS